ncbi:reverse transcriptase domain-containing protein [Tanacetum coccineum]
MSATANTTPIVTTVTKATNKEKTPKEVDAASRVNILDFCEEHYEDILPVIMDKIRSWTSKRSPYGWVFRECQGKSKGWRRSSKNSRLEHCLQTHRLPCQIRPKMRNASETTTMESILQARDRSRSMKRGRVSKSPLSRVSESSTSDGGHWKSTSKRHKPTDEEDLAVPWTCEENRRSRGSRENFPSRSTGGTLGNAYMVSYVQFYPNRGRESMQKKYVKDPVEIHNIKQRGRETIRDFMERFKVETGRMKGAPECMRISGFMHGVNNPELTKRLNEHVPKTMEEMMTATTAFIQGEVAAASKKKGHTSWKPLDQPKRHVSERKSDFRGKFKPPAPMVTLVEKRSSNKFCDFHNDKGHNTDECMQSKKQIEEFLRASKLSHLIKEIKQGRDQPKVGKKEVPAKEKSMEIYMVKPWHRMTRQKVTQSFACVSKITFPPLTTSSGTEGPLVIEAKIGGHTIHRMYVDGGSSTEVLYEHCFNRLRPEIKSQMVPATTSLTSFSGETIWPLRQLRLIVTIGDTEHSTKAWMNFMIVRSLSSYNGIIGRPEIKEIQAVPSTAHGMLKFPDDEGIVTIHSTILIPAECTTMTTSSKEILKEAEVRHENFKVALHLNFLDQEVAIGGTLSAKGRTELCSLLKENLDIFAWQSSDMTGVSRSVAKHWLNIREGYSPVRQKKRGQASKRAKAILAEVQKLVEAGIMREVYYHDWLSNPVMVKKHDSSWRMCVDFTDLNKACPQDCYPFPEIDWKVESLCSYPYKCFLDTYKGYHQIQMAEPDEEKMTFHTIHGVYCYTKMPFGLKNAGATYQRLVDKAFDNQVGRNIKVGRNVLGVHDQPGRDKTVSQQNKTEVVLRLPSPRKIEEVQSLNGKLASLNRFLSKSTEKSLPLFKTLKKCIKKSDFHWTPEAEQVFKQLKQHLSKLPMLVAPKPKEELIVYLSASYRSSLGPELNYTPMEKLVLALVFAAKRLRRYFQAHPIAVITHQPIKQIISHLDVAGRLQKWSVMLGEHNITYRPRTSVKGQILADFLIEKSNKAPPDTSVFTASNNEAEYEALIAGLRIAAQMGVCNVHVSVDSKMVANQVLGTYVAKEENMIKYLEKAKSLISGFDNFSISQVPRSKNKKADVLSKIASTSFTHLSKQVLVEVLKEKSIQEEEVATVVEEEGPTWMTPIMEYLKDGTFPDDRKEASKLLGSGKSRGDNHRQSGEEVRVGQHSVPLRPPERNSLGQWSLGEGIKARLGEGNKICIEEIPHVLWAHRTMIKSSHGDTPFSLTYGTKAVIPAEIGMPTYHIAVMDAVHNDEELRLNLDLLEERSEHAVIREAKAKLKMTKYYNARVRGVTFRPGDFVYHSNKVSHAVDGGKLGPKW